ncbi:MAG: hypothetical protein WCW87_03800 [Candidatus Paceibacterota bacterium]
MNTSKFVGIVTIIIILVGGLYFFVSKKQAPATTPNMSQTTSEFDAKNATYNIDGKAFTLKNGESKIEAAPGSASMITTRYFGNEARGDLNSDGKEDIAFLITQDGGGSGLFYYVVVALKTNDGYKTTNAFFVGDRIAPQTTEINTSASELYVNFAERKPGESMTTQPSQGATLYLKVTSDGKLTGLMQ